MKDDTPLDLLSDLLLDYMIGKHTQAMIRLTELDTRQCDFVHGFAHWLDAITDPERLDRARALQDQLNREAR